MKNGKKKALATPHKFELLVAILDRNNIRRILDKYTSEQLVEAHSFLWDKLVELHYLTQKTEFIRESVTQRMTPSANYQREQGCDLRIDYCKGVECIWSNPICAGNKVKNNMEVMAEILVEYLAQTDDGRDSNVQSGLQGVEKVL